MEIMLVNIILTSCLQIRCQIDVVLMSIFVFRILEELYEFPRTKNIVSLTSKPCMIPRIYLHSDIPIFSFALVEFNSKSDAKKDYNRRFQALKSEFKKSEKKSKGSGHVSAQIDCVDKIYMFDLTLGTWCEPITRGKFYTI